MDIIIEGKKVAFDLPSEGVKLKQLAAEGEEFLLSRGRIAMGLKLNGKALKNEEYEKLQEQELKEGDTVEFLSMELFAFLQESIAGVVKANENLLVNLRLFSEGLEKNKSLIERSIVVGELQDFFKFWGNVWRLLPEEVKKEKFGSTTLLKHLESLEKSLERVVSNMEKEAFSSAATVVNEEMIPSVETIDQVIPKLRESLGEFVKRSA